MKTILRRMPIAAVVMALAAVAPVSAAVSTYKNHVQHARAALLKNNLKEAGHELRAAGDELGRAAADAPGAAKEGLAASAREMRTLAADVEKGTVTDVNELDRASARGYHALANERFVTASEAWTRKDAHATGVALKDAADHLEDGAAAAGKDTGSASRQVAERTRGVAGKLVQGSGWTTEQVGRAMDDFGKELTGLGKRVGSSIKRG